MCPDCNDTGRVKCGTCRGTGRVHGDTCMDCAGAATFACGCAQQQEIPIVCRVPTLAEQEAFAREFPEYATRWT